MVQAHGTALVTGGARRIGAAIVRDLAAHGFAVAIHCGHSRREADALAQTVEKDGGRAAVLQADLTDSREAALLVERTEAALGFPCIVVNNASVFEDDAVTDLDMALWDRHFAVHLKAPALIAQALAARLPAGGEALIVNMIDQRVWRPTPRFFSYTLSKSALWTATQTMAQALGPNIRVNAIGPGPTLPNQRQEQADFDRQTEALILRRGPDLAEFGRTVRYIWEARSVTGQMIALDGGQHLAWETPDVAGVPE
ncbi:SDR family oxidoreductase [Nitratireductor pacificus]|uniref:Short chain dehydrogenase n=1 Tax=Nitratireductor pacificus pht-3B TaxID=391937 RepID=K2MDQ9_9HYPH|nr:SDR family oxidoreductase [Nitratireductor pacificus]EKF20311.1 short chain dehydrogenase [Nitratireductor pacificus pht-3B]